MLSKALPNDEWGLQTLTILLRCALHAWRDYHARGIEDAVFTATMKCFSRYEREHEVSYGRIGFDRTFWVPRHLSLLLFRFGELEYELSQPTGLVHLHIPSDSKLLYPALHGSWQMAQVFFKEHAPAYADAIVRCESWLLSPALKELLPESSRILQFQKAFTPYAYDPDASDYLEWVYKLGQKDRGNVALTNLPENTFLQKAMKRHLLSGGKVAIGWGTLNREPFV